LFTERIFENHKIAERLRAGIFEWVTWERKFRYDSNEYCLGFTNPPCRLEHAFREQVPILISQLISHKQYSPFEAYYIDITTTFYLAESKEQAQELNDDPKAFFKYAYQRIEEEGQRSKAALPVGSWSLVREATEKAIWAGRLEWLASESMSVCQVRCALANTVQLLDRTC
jgi:cullin-4